MKLKIRYLREREKWTQKDLAGRLGVGVQTVSKWEVGTNEPNIDTLVKMADLFGVTVDYLIGASDDNAGSHDYVYIMGADGTRKKVFIPEADLPRFRALISAGMPDLMEEE